jgi:hypothetical protein
MRSGMPNRWKKCSDGNPRSNARTILVFVEVDGFRTACCDFLFLQAVSKLISTGAVAQWARIGCGRSEACGYRFLGRS